MRKLILVILLLLGSVWAQEKEQEKHSVRIRSQYWEDGDFWKTRQGVSYGPGINQFTDLARIYHNHIENDDSITDYFAFGGKLPKFKIVEDLNNQTTVFGQLGDVNGGGLESKFTYKDSLLIMNFEGRDFDNEVGTRTGFGYDHKLMEKWTLGVGYDWVRKWDEDDHYLLLKAMYDMTKKDSFGISLQNKAGQDYYGLNWYYTHYGLKEKWGARVLTSYRHIEGTDDFFGYLVLVQKPTLWKEDSTWWVGRNSDDGMDPGFGDSAVLQEEPLSTAERTQEGFAMVIKGGYVATPEYAFSYLKNSVAYTWKIGMYKPSVTLEYNTDFESAYAGGGVELRIKDIFKIEWISRAPMDDGEVQHYAGIQFGVKW
jgi:hypothetical protein